jgi:hypothetical protein
MYEFRANQTNRQNFTSSAEILYKHIKHRLICILFLSRKRLNATSVEITKMREVSANSHCFVDWSEFFFSMNFLKHETELNTAQIVSFYHPTIHNLCLHYKAQQINAACGNNRF